ncbi:MAG: nucleotidyltransferase domain-containing protein [Armatimonadetes bacterium]|nr:nucleotidyltransferase domain-containing protein [Armatimonadota bacterium]
MRNKSCNSVKIFSPPYSRDELVEVLREGLRKLAEVLPVKLSVLFGSWAKGRATAFSDIDLLVIYADPPREEAYKLVRKTIGIRGLEPHVYSESEAKQVKHILERMIADGIVLFDGD